ncbi:transposase related protein [Panicum miliaceum]|uniref:Transposase related protein n=1 Tax=Panicum miliaceum TaxID=4540 RepID=A0A3L6TFG1_PANMI|nr:transposase related protein [Panicum miliaceum]
MDNVVTVYHGGTVEEDEFGNVTFVEMQRIPLIFDERPLFIEVFGRARDEVHCNSNEDAISVEGVHHYGKSRQIFRWLVQIAFEGSWEKYVNSVMKNDFQRLDLVVRKLSNDPSAQLYSPPNGHSPPLGLSPEHDIPAPFYPPLPNNDVEDVVVVPDAQSGPNEFEIFPNVGAQCPIDGCPPTLHDIPLTQNHPN